MKDEYVEKLAAIAYELSEASKEIMGAIEWYVTDSKSLYLDSEERAWKALDVALTIIKNDRSDVWKKKLSTLPKVTSHVPKETEDKKQ
jgi:hypothetical protein